MSFLCKNLLNTHEILTQLAEMLALKSLLQERKLTPIPIEFYQHQKLRANCHRNALNLISNKYRIVVRRIDLQIYTFSMMSIKR